MYAFANGMMRPGNGFERAGEFGDHGGALGIVGMVLCIILWAALITALVLAIIALVRRLRGGGTKQVALVSQPAAAQTGEPTEESEALRVLQERYARGELGHEEYLERKGNLTTS
jgi:uncharacterized membrane protein